MGANTFGVAAEGKTADDAFAEATRQARHEHGHGGYTGTIAEKRDFFVVDADREAPRLIERLEEKRAQLTLAKQKRNAARIAKIRAKEWSQISSAERDELDALREAGHVTDPARLASMRARLTEQIKALRGKRSRAQTVAHVLLDLGDPCVDDKWGPAGCVKIGRGVWYFFGWASS